MSVKVGVTHSGRRCDGECDVSLCSATVGPGVRSDRYGNGQIARPWPERGRVGKRDVQELAMQSDVGMPYRLIQKEHDNMLSCAHAQYMHALCVCDRQSGTQHLSHSRRLVC